MNTNYGMNHRKAEIFKVSENTTVLPPTLVFLRDWARRAGFQDMINRIHTLPLDVPKEERQMPLSDILFFIRLDAKQRAC